MIIVFHLFLTLALELLVYSFGDKFRFKSVIAMFTANLILNMTMNLIVTQMENEELYLIFIICAEIFAFVTEAFLFFLFTNKKLWYCFLISFTANILSLAIGNVFNQTGLIYKNGVVFPLTVAFSFIVSSIIGISLGFYLYNKFILSKTN